MLSMLSRYWWAVALRGLFAILFGILALIWPSLTLLTLVYLFGAYVLVDGVFGVINGIQAYGERKRWWLLVLEGLLGIVVGILTFLWPDITALTLLYLIAAWAIITGVLEIVQAIQLRKVIRGELLWIIGGALSVIFGFLLILFPGAGALSVIWLIGVYSILFGILLIILGFRLRGMKGRTDDTPMTTPRQLE